MEEIVIRHSVCSALLTGTMAALLPATASAADYHVDGAATAPGSGTVGAPWTDIQRGVDALGPGDTLVVHAGTYDVAKAIQVKSKHGTGTQPIVIRAEGAALLRGGDRDRGVWQGLINVQGSEWVTIEGLSIEDAGFFGILFQNVDHGSAVGNATNRTNASGIASWTSSNLTLRGNDVQSCCNAGQMGSGTSCQECISLDHVDGFLIEGNLVHDSQQNGLAQWGGGEGIDVKNGSSHGVVRGNEVHHIVQLGIYLDAWETDITDVEIVGNLVHHNANGIIITSEQTGNYGNIRIHDNVVYDNGFDGFSVSHYQVSNPTVTDIRIYNNTSVHNGFPGSKPYFLSQAEQSASWGRGITIGDPDIVGLVISDNIFFDNASAQMELVAGLASPTLEHNLVGPAVGPNGSTGSHAVQTSDPRFLDYAGRDLRLAEGSPAIDAGLGGPNIAATDFLGNARVLGTAVDIGAFEYGATPVGDAGWAFDASGSAGGGGSKDGGAATGGSRLSDASGAVGGSTALGGGAATGGLDSAQSSASGDQGACSCRTAERSTGSSAGAMGVLVLVMAACRRRLAT
jgi:hypothetical protein